MPIVIFFIILATGLILAFSIVDGRKMIKCKACGKEMAKSAKACPHCGAETPGKIIGDIAGGVVGGCFLIPVVFALVVMLTITSLNSNTNSNDVNPTDITLAEFSQIQYGMTYDQCRIVIGGGGEVVAETTEGNVVSTTIFWSGNNGTHSGATIMFQNGTVCAMFSTDLK